MKEMGPLDESCIAFVMRELLLVRHRNNMNPMNFNASLHSLGLGIPSFREKNSS
jgi:hypothetical protein